MSRLPKPTCQIEEELAELISQRPSESAGASYYNWCAQCSRLKQWIEYAKNKLSGASKP